MSARPGIESKTAIHAYARPSQRPPAITDEVAHARRTRSGPLVLSGTARQTYHADRHTNEYARNNGSTSTSDSANVSPCRLSTPAMRMPTTAHAPRYSASRSGRVRIGCMPLLALDVHAAHHHEAAQHESSAGFVWNGVGIGRQRRESLVFHATHEGQDRRADFPIRRHDNFHAAHDGDDVENGFFTGRDRREPQVQLPSAHDRGDVAAAKR